MLKSPIQCRALACESPPHVATQYRNTHVFHPTGYGPSLTLPNRSLKMSSTTPREAISLNAMGPIFPLWRLGLWTLLEEHNLEEIVTGTSTKLIEERGPASGDPPQPGRVTNSSATADLKRRDCKARGLILSTVKVDQQLLLISWTNAHQMWEALSAQHVEHAAKNQYSLLSS